MTENFNIQRIFEAIQEPLPEMLSNTIEELNKRLNNMAELFLEYYPLSQDTSGTALKNLKAASKHTAELIRLLDIPSTYNYIVFFHNTPDKPRMDFLLVREDEKATEPRLTSTLKALLSAFDTAAHGIESRKKQGKGRTPHFEDFDRLHWEGWLMEGLKIIYKAITGKTPTQSAYEYGEYTTFEKFASEIIRLINIELKGRGCYISISPKSRLKHKNCHKSP